MKKRSVFLSFAAGVAFALCAVTTPAKAAGIPVYYDAGSGTVNATGTTTGATVNMVNPTTTASIFDVNGTAVSMTLGLAENILGSGSTVTGGTGSKVISEGDASVVLHYSITGGSAGLGFLDVSGVIIGSSGSNNVSGYDFTALVGKPLTVTDTQTGVNFALLLGNSGAASPGGTLGVTEGSLVPEPTSLSLLGIGMIGFFATRRFLRRASTTA